MKYQTHELKKKIHRWMIVNNICICSYFSTKHFFVLSDFYIAFVIVKKLSGISFLFIIQVNI